MDRLDVRIDVDNGTSHGILKSPQGCVLPMCIEEGGSSIRPALDEEVGAPSVFCACRQPDPSVALLPFEAFDASQGDLQEYISEVASNLCTHVSYMAVGAHHELGCTNVEETLGPQVVGATETIFVAEEQLTRAALSSESVCVKFISAVRKAQEHVEAEQRAIWSSFMHFMQATGVNRTMLDTYKVKPLNILDYADEECPIGWAPGSFGRRTRTMNRYPVVKSEDFARIEKDLGLTSRISEGVFLGKAAELGSFTIDHLRRTPTDLSAVAPFDPEERLLYGRHISISNCHQVHNAATDVLDLLSSMTHFLKPEEGTRAHGIATVASSFVASVCKAAMTNSTKDLYEALAKPPSTENFDWAMQQLCQACGDYGDASVMNKRIARFSAAVAARVVFGVARAFIDVEAQHLLSGWGGFAGVVEGVEVVGGVRKAVEEILSTFTIDPSKIHFLGYMPVAAPAGVDPNAYARVRDEAYSDGHAFPHAHLFSQHLQDIDALIGAASADDLIKRAYYTKALSSLFVGWSSLLGPSAIALKDALPLFVIYQDEALLSSEVQGHDIIPESEYMWPYSEIVAESWGFNDVFFSCTRAAISSGILVSSRTTHPMSCVPIFGEQPVLSAMDALAHKARAMFNAGVIPSTMDPTEGLDCGYVSAYALWPVAEASEDVRIHDDEKARAFLSVSHSERVIYSLGGAHCIDPEDRSGDFLPSNAVFTFHKADVKFRVARALLSLDPVETAAHVVETIDDIVSLLIARLVISVFVGFSLCCDANRISVGQCYTLANSSVQQTLDVIQISSCEALQEAAAVCIGQGALVPYKYGRSATPGMAELAAFFLSPEGIDTSFLADTTLDPMSLGLDDVLGLAKSLVAHVMEEKYLRHSGHPWAALWSSVATIGLARPHGFRWDLPSERNSSNYTGAIAFLRKTLYLSGESSFANTIELPIGFRSGWTSDLLCEFLRTLDRRQYLGFLGEWVVSGQALKVKVLDAGESRDVLTSVWEALLKHGVLVHNEDGTVRFCDSVWPHVCDECNSPVGCRVMDQACLQGIGKLILLSQSLMTFAHNRVNFESTTAQFSLPFALDRGQALMLFSHIFTLDPRDGVKDERLERSVPGVTGEFNDMFAYGARRATVFGPAEVADIMTKLENIVCPCIDCAPRQNSLDLLVNCKRLSEVECAFHPLPTPAASVSTWLTRRVLKDSPFETILRITRTSLSPRVLFSEWYDDFFTHPVSNINEYLSSRIQFSIDDEIPEEESVMGLLCIKQMMRLWVRSLSPDMIAVFLRHCTAQNYLQPSASVYVHVVADAEDSLETAEQRNQTVSYQTCLNQVIVPLSLVESLFNSLDLDSGSCEELKAKMNLAFL